MGLSDCRVSVPLSASEVITDAKRSGNPNPEDNAEWVAIVEARQPGDKLREVNCLAAISRGEYRDPYYFALFRDDVVVLKFHPVIID
ncbi:MAG: hypothetical protein H7A20_11855 [Rhodanobacteraceae bacterium]|nr:hypothetical protein [Xanthomonadales bacterium]MCP5479453.1 hypothetical protein [Rhodanobacteraceae bacterium]